MENGNRAETPGTRVETAGRVSQTDRLGIGGRALRSDVAVVVVAPDFSIEIDELRRRDRAAVEGLQAVLHADVVERAPGEAGLRVAPKARDVGVPHRAARALRI